MIASGMMYLPPGYSSSRFSIVPWAVMLAPAFLVLAALAIVTGWFWSPPARDAVESRNRTLEFGTKAMPCNSWPLFSLLSSSSQCWLRPS